VEGLRIGLVSAQADPLAVVDVGEQHRYVAELSRALTREGHEVHVYTRRDGEPGRRTVRDGVVVEYGPSGEVAEFTGWLRDRWRRGWLPEVVHSQGWLSGLATVPAAAERGIPVAHTYHSLGTVRRRWYGRAEPTSRERVRSEKALGASVDRVVALFHGEVADLARIGLPRTRIAVVAPGVDTDVFSPKGDAVPADPARVLTIGVPEPGSGFDELIKLLRWVPDAELVIAGGPAPDDVETDPRIDRLRRLAGSLDLADRIRFLGAVPAAELPRWYRSAHVYVSASATGTFGLPAVEAMACGLPVVAYGSGGVSESVVHRVTGLLVQPHDLRGFALALRGLLRNDLDRLAYADAGVDRAQSRYDWRRVIIDIVRVYEDVRRRS